MVFHTKFQIYRYKKWALCIPVIIFGIENDNTFDNSAMFNIL